MSNQFIHIECGRPQKQRKQRPALDLKRGDKVLRKSDASRRLAIGEVEWVSNGRARIKWPAPTRIGGECHHSTVKLNSPDLLMATPEAIAERRRDVRLDRVKGAMRELISYGPRDGDAYYERRINQKVHLLLEASRELEAIRRTA
jgi:hypothetical protein